jgi:hypothetical protein
MAYIVMRNIYNLKLGLTRGGAQKLLFISPPVKFGQLYYKHIPCGI